MDGEHGESLAEQSASQRHLKRDLTRIVYWANQGRWSVSEMLGRAGYAHFSRDRRTQAGLPYKEWCVQRGPDTLAFIHEFEDESFLFMWTPHAQRPRWQRWFWRLRHPRTRSCMSHFDSTSASPDLSPQPSIHAVEAAGRRSHVGLQ